MATFYPPPNFVAATVSRGQSGGAGGPLVLTANPTIITDPLDIAIIREEFPGVIVETGPQSIPLYPGATLYPSDTLFPST